jgi:hypothetical protein
MVLGVITTAQPWREQDNCYHGMCNVFNKGKPFQKRNLTWGYI